MENSFCYKISYNSHLEAMQAISNHRFVPGKPKAKRRAYQCPFCRKWHLTSEEKNAHH